MLLTYTFRAPKLARLLLFKQAPLLASLLLLLVLCSCTVTKNISSNSPYKQCIGKNFILKEDMYIFQDYSTSTYSIAGKNSGINGLPRLVNEKYIGRNKNGIFIKTIVQKGSIFTLVKVIDAISFEGSFTRFLISFDDLPFTKKGIITTAILNLDNPPYTKTWSDPPIFDAKLVEPLPSDGTWWK